MPHFTLAFRPINPNAYPLTGWVVGIRPGIVGAPPVTTDLKQLPPVGKLAYRAREGETLIARAELKRSRLAIVHVSSATCEVRNARTNALAASVTASYADGRLSAPLTLPQGIYDVTFTIVSPDATMVTMVKPIRLLVGPSTQT